VSERPPAAAYGFRRDKLLQAIDILRSEGLVFTVLPRGTYVSPDAK
jgi:DNA-binding GntR family transcriptional regulator